MSRPPIASTSLKSGYRRARPAPRFDLSATVVAPPISWTFPIIPQIPVAQPVTPPGPVTLSVGNLEVDLSEVVAAVVRFVAEHPVLCATIAVSIIFAVWHEQQARHAHASRS